MENLLNNPSLVTTMIRAGGPTGVHAGESRGRMAGTHTARVRARVEIDTAAHVLVRAEKIQPPPKAVVQPKPDPVVADAHDNMFSGPVCSNVF